MAETPGGLVKQSVQFTPEQMAWLRQRAASKGRASIAAVIRELIGDTMALGDVTVGICPTCRQEWLR